MKNVTKGSSIVILILLITVIIFFLYKKNKSSRYTIPHREIQYSETSVVINDQVIDEGDIYKIIGPLYWGVNIYEGQEKYENELKKFSIPQRYVFAICWYRDEVNNGGHDQFYFNSAGIVWEDALNGFKEAGLLEFYRVLRESTQKMGGTPSKDRGVRQEQLDKLKPNFDDLDTEYFKLERKINMDSVLLEYVKKNRQKFYFNGVVKMPKGV